MVLLESDRVMVKAPMTMGNTRAMLEEGVPFFGAQPRVVDLSGVTMADSSGLTVLLEWLRLSRSAGGSLSLVGVPSGLAALADLYDVGEILLGAGA